MPYEWQARQTILAIFQVSSSMHNAKKITTRARGPFHQSITASLTEEKREVCVCVRAGVCVCACTMKESAIRMASTTNDTGDISSKKQHAQRKENYNKSKRPVSSVNHCHSYRRKKRSFCVCVCVREREKDER